MFDEAVKEIALRPPTTEASVRPYAYEVSLDTTAKGYIQPSVKIRSDDVVIHAGELVVPIEKYAVKLLYNLVMSLRDSYFKVATDIEDIPKNGQ